MVHGVSFYTLTKNNKKTEKCMILSRKKSHTHTHTKKINARKNKSFGGILSKQKKKLIKKKTAGSSNKRLKWRLFTYTHIHSNCKCISFPL